MGNNSKILYALDCDHAAPGLDTLVNGILFCAWHQEMQKIVGVIIYEWAAKCRSCTHVKWAGLSKHNAMIFANRHSVKHPDHVVGPEYRINPNAARTAKKMLDWKVRQN